MWPKPSDSKHLMIWECLVGADSFSFGFSIEESSYSFGMVDLSLFLLTWYDPIQGQKLHEAELDYLRVQMGPISRSSAKRTKKALSGLVTLVLEEKSMAINYMNGHDHFESLNITKVQQEKAPT